jgi:outer membrane receptor protein involved in Fe transport
MFAGKLLPGSRAPTNATLLTFYDQYVAESLPSIRTAARLSGSAAPEIRKWRANMVTRYEFTRGFIRGLSVGGAMRWQDKIGIGYPYVTAGGITAADITRPYFGPAETQFDATVSYRRKLKIMGSAVNWVVSLNVRNLDAKDELIPIASNPDGSWGTFRIPPERTWSVSNTLSF